jgi:hypothetical protein
MPIDGSTSGEPFTRVLRYLASGQILVDVGRAVGGDFVRVWLPPEVAARVAKEQF